MIKIELKRYLMWGRLGKVCGDYSVLQEFRKSLGERLLLDEMKCKSN